MVLATWKDVPLTTAPVPELLGEETKVENVSIFVSEDSIPRDIIWRDLVMWLRAVECGY